MEQQGRTGLLSVGPRPESERGGLLSVEESSSRARPLRRWSAAERGRVAHAATRVVREWSRDWGLEPSRSAKEGEATQCEASSSAERGMERAGWQGLGVAATGLWWRLSIGEGQLPGVGAAQLGELLSPLSRVMFGEALEESSAWPGELEAGGASRPTIATEVVRASWGDLEARLGSALGASPAGFEQAAELVPPRAALDGWSGALCVAIPWWGRKLEVLVSYDRVRRLLGPSVASESRPPGPGGAPVRPLSVALAGRRTRLRVQLTALEIDLGALTSLRASDVLLTTHALDEPLSVIAVDADDRSVVRLCGGILGKLGTARAVELVERPPVEPAAERVVA